MPAPGRARSEGGESFFTDDADLAASFTANERREAALVTHDARISDEAARTVVPPPPSVVDAWSSFDDELPKRLYQRDQEDTSCARGGRPLVLDASRM